MKLKEQADVSRVQTPAANVSSLLTEQMSIKVRNLAAFFNHPHLFKVPSSESNNAERVATSNAAVDVEVPAPEASANMPAAPTFGLSSSSGRALNSSNETLTCILPEENAQSVQRKNQMCMEDDIP